MMNSPLPPSMSSNGVVQGWHLITTPHTKKEKVQTKTAPPPKHDRPYIISSSVPEAVEICLGWTLGWGEKERGAWHYITIP